MTSGILIVESRPASDEEAEAYHDWYDNTHFPEMLRVDGFVSARRLQALEGGSFIAIYEIKGDVEAAKAALAVAQSFGTLTRPEGLQLEPPPSVRYFESLS